MPSAVHDEIVTSVASPLDVGSSESDDGSTYSLTPSITNYQKAFGRTYHAYKEGSYPYPNDSLEIERLDAGHYILTALHNGHIFYAPLKKLRRILDVGTGTGTWAIQMGYLFPEAEVIGTDLSPIQPRDMPDNVFFEIDDCSETDWARPFDSYDFIHTQMMLGCLVSFKKFIKTSRKYLRPGSGWLECHELDPLPRCDDDTMPADFALTKWNNLHEESIQMMDEPRSCRIAPEIARWMREAGFVDIRERIDKIPVNPWPKDSRMRQIGTWWEQCFLDGLAGFSYKILGPEGHGWSKTEIDVFLIDVRNAIADRHIHAYQNLYVVYGRRPNPDEESKLQRKRPAPA